MRILRIILTIFASIYFYSNIVMAQETSAPTLKHEMTAKLMLAVPMAVEPNQTIFNVLPEGSSIKLSSGEVWDVINPCADWGYSAANGTVQQMIRCTAKADDGSIIRIDYKGRVALNESGVKKIETSEIMTSPEDMYFITTPTFYTTSEKYAWLNDRMFVGKGTLQWWNDKGKPAFVEYHWYSVNP